MFYFVYFKNFLSDLNKSLFRCENFFAEQRTIEDCAPTLAHPSERKKQTPPGNGLCHLRRRRSHIFMSDRTALLREGRIRLLTNSQ